VLTVIVAPVILGGGKRLFEGFTMDMELEHKGVHRLRRQALTAASAPARVA
jgi:hypothetical protein